MPTPLLLLILFFSSAKQTLVLHVCLSLTTSILFIFMLQSHLPFNTKIGMAFGRGIYMDRTLLFSQKTLGNSLKWTPLPRSGLFAFQLPEGPEITFPTSSPYPASFQANPQSFNNTGLSCHFLPEAFLALFSSVSSHSFLVLIPSLI